MFDQNQLIKYRKELSKVGIPYRDNMRLKFFDILSIVEFEHQYDKTKVIKLLCKTSINLEKELFNKYRLPRDYATKCRSLIFNLSNEKNPLLRYRILFGDLLPEEIIQGGPELFQTDDDKSFRERIIKEDMLARRTDWGLE